MWKNAVMNIAVMKKIVAAVVLMLSATAVLAGPPAPGRAPGQANDFRQQGGGGYEGNGRPAPQHEQDANQRRGKLSADERRELRRQIDEAGQDIYRVKR